MTPPKHNVFIRNENEPAWLAKENKSEWINSMLEQDNLKPLGEIESKIVEIENELNYLKKQQEKNLVEAERLNSLISEKRDVLDSLLNEINYNIDPDEFWMWTLIGAKKASDSKQDIGMRNKLYGVDDVINDEVVALVNKKTERVGSVTKGPSFRKSTIDKIAAKLEQGFGKVRETDCDTVEMQLDVIVAIHPHLFVQNGWICYNPHIHHDTIPYCPRCASNEFTQYEEMFDECANCGHKFQIEKEFDFETTKTTQRDAAQIVARNWELNEEYDLEYCVNESRKHLDTPGKAMPQVFDVLSVNYPNRTKRSRKKDENVDIFWRIGDGENRRFRLYNPTTDGPVIYHMKSKD